MKNVKVYVGNSSSDGIYSYELKNSKLINKNCTKDFSRCTYLTMNKKNLYGTIEISDEKNNGNGYIVSYKKENNNLKFLNKKISYGKGPCHLEFNEENNILLVSNYIDGAFSAFLINEDNGKIGEKIYNEIIKEEISHLHCAKFSLDNKFIFTLDLGEDKISAYELKGGKIQKIDELEFEPNTEPRHMVFDRERIYVVTEKSCKLYSIQFTSRKLKIDNVISIDKEENKKMANTGCAIKISNDFKYIYISIRGSNLINVFKINKYSIKMIQSVSCAGKLPWDLEIDPSGNYVLVANHGSNEIAIFRRNKINGKIIFKNKQQVNLPTCIIME